MKRLAYVIIAALALTACGNNNRNSNKIVSEEDMVENGKIGYADLVSFLVQGFQNNWDSISPEDQGLSPVYSYNSKYAGYAIKDINGDGIDELLIGDQFEDSRYDIYDIYTINPADGSLIHLAKGGERDRFAVNGSGVITESGSNSADDSFSKGYVIKDGKLKKVQDWDDSQLAIEFEHFMTEAPKDEKMRCGGYTEEREPTDEEYQLFKKVTDTIEGMTFTPLTVRTQVVAGINYMFYCRFSDGTEENNPGHCWLTIYKPLPGQGDPKVTSMERD